MLSLFIQKSELVQSVHSEAQIQFCCLQPLLVKLSVSIYQVYAVSNKVDPQWLRAMAYLEKLRFEALKMLHFIVLGTPVLEGTETAVIIQSHNNLLWGKRNGAIVKKLNNLALDINMLCLITTHSGMT